MAKEHTRLALSNFTKALHAGRSKPDSWKTGVDQSIRQCLNGKYNNYYVQLHLVNLKSAISGIDFT